ncbi:MAG: CBS domain-containing protein [Gammaproteobacteria bacterium]|nr:CBS domain-containing protein [Gammaproteobacteria bacterium]
MSVGEYCNRSVVVVEKTEPVREAINLMRKNHVGDVVVVEMQENASIPLGILTDRDIVVEILAEDVDIDSVNVGDVMSYRLVTVNEDTKLLDAIKQMRIKGVRRLPVVNESGELQGILSTDDLLELVVEQLSDIVGLVSKEITNEIKTRK